MVKKSEEGFVYRGEVEFARHAFKEISDLQFVRGVVERAANTGEAATVQKVEELLKQLQHGHGDSPKKLVEMAMKEVGLREMTLPEMRYRMYYAIASEFSQGRIDLHAAESRLLDMITPKDVSQLPSAEAQELRQVLELASEIDQLCDACARQRPVMEKQLYAAEIEIKSDKLSSILRAAAERIRE